MGLAPRRDVVVVVAIGDRPAHHQQQHLRQRVRHLPGLAGIVDLRKMVKQRPQARFLSKDQGCQRHAGSPNLSDPDNHARRKP